MTRILGIDPGSRITGFGVIDSDGVRSRHLVNGCLRVHEADFPARLGRIFTGIAQLIEEHLPEALAIEQVFVSKNVASAMKLGQARGAAICAAVTSGLPVHEYSPRSVKQAVVGTGGADKAQVQHMVRMLLNLVAEPASDAADALAVAIAHAHSSVTNKRLMQAAGWRR